MPPAVLKGIETNQNLEFVQKVEAVFMWWHYNMQNATYRSFMQVCIELDEGGLAREMCRLCAKGLPNQRHTDSPIEPGPSFVCPYCKECTLEQYLSESGCPKSSGRTLYPYLKTPALSNVERRVLEATLSSDAERMVELFADVIYILNNLKDDVKVDSVKNYVMNLISSVECKDKLEKVDSMSKIFSTIRHNKSFFNFKIIKIIADKFGSPEAKSAMAEYITKFEKFCRRSTFEIPRNVYPKPDSQAILSVKVHVKTEVDDKFYFKQANLVTECIASILDIKEWYLQICSIENGCVCIRYSVAKHIFAKIFPPSASQLAALKHKNFFLVSPTSIESYENNLWTAKTDEIEHPGGKLVIDKSDVYTAIASTATQYSMTPTAEDKATKSSMEMPPVRPASVCNEETIPSSMDRTPPTLELASNPESRNILTVPITRNITHKSVELKWIPPDPAVECYTVFYHQQRDPDNTLKKLFVDGRADHYLIDGLTYNTRYVFKLQAKLSTGVNLESDETDTVKTLAYPVSLDMQSKSKLLSAKTYKQPAIYELTKKKIVENQDKRLAKYEVGQLIQYCPEKVLMLVGATGAGKTTLVNGIANYMYGVQWDDDFRFVLVDNEPKKSEAHSQTSWITAYTLHRAPDSPVPYSLTIIDTPGFGDTKGIERDKKIVDQFKDFFSIKPPEGINVIHGIGFSLAQASLTQLSHLQKYIFDSILSIYGRDIASNIFLMTTFADGQDPPVMDAIVEAKIPYQKYFKFNNSALFVNGKEGTFDAMFWEMGMKGFQSFFSDFGKAEHRSLQLTREVLNERKQLENVLQQLQPQIHFGLTKMDELQRVVIMLEHNKSLIEQNKDFLFKISLTKLRKVDTPPGQYTTNCLTCNCTCHDNCDFANNDDKKRCCAMDSDGYCKVCPGNCIWSKHVNNPYIFEVYEEEEVRTSKELKSRYDTAREGIVRAEEMMSNIKDNINSLEIIVLDLVNKARKSLMRLDDIALKPNPLSEVDYIDLLIQSEEKQCKRGWMERIASYKVLRKRASLMRKIKNGHNSKDDVQESLFSWLCEDGASSSYTPQTLGYLRDPAEKKKWYQFWKS